MPAQPGFRGLSPRELDVLGLMADGLSNEAIARRTCLSIKSIEAVVRSVFIKLGLVGPAAEENRRVRAVRAFLEYHQGPHPSSLPEPTSTFVGRLPELGELMSLLEQHRLVSIVGPGGIGKTRLALQLGAQVRQQARDVTFVDLAATNGDAVGAIGAAFDVTAPTAAAARRQLLRRLGRDHRLVILDNAEHLLAEVADIVGEVLLSTGAFVVVTSRQALLSAGEVVWHTPPLALADASELLRSRATQAGADLSGIPDHQIERWCDRLGSMPLAIELAAGRLAGLPPLELEVRLDQLPRLLQRPTTDRHRSLDAAIQSSYDALAPSVAATWRQTSVFVGPFTLDAARRVALGDVAERDISDDLDILVRACLVELRGGRYRLLEPLRQYAADRLGEHPDRGATHDRLIAWATELCRGAAMGMHTDPQRWRDRLDAEAATLEAAILSAARTGNTGAAVRVLRALHFYWTDRRPATGYRISQEVVGACADARPRDRAWALICAGSLGAIAANVDTAAVMLAEAAAIMRTEQDSVGEATALTWLGRQTGDPSTLDRAIELAQASHAPVIEAWGLLFRANLIVRPWDGYHECSRRLDQAEAVIAAIPSPALRACLDSNRAVSMLIANWTGETSFGADAIDACLARALAHDQTGDGARGDEGIRQLMCLARLHHGPDAAATDAIAEHLATVADTDDRLLISEALLIAAGHLFHHNESATSRSSARLAGPVVRTYAHEFSIRFVLGTAPELLTEALAPASYEPTTEELLAAATVCLDRIQSIRSERRGAVEQVAVPVDRAEARGQDHLRPTERVGAARRASIVTMGRFEVVVDDAPVAAASWGSRQARTLLKLLVVARGRPVMRDELIERLWPDGGGDMRRLAARLSVQLSAVRRVLGAGLITDRSSVRLDLDQVEVDIESWFAEEDDERIIAGFGGEFLAEDRYSDWSSGLRDQVRARFVTTICRLAEHGPPDRAVELWARALTEDPYLEAAHRSMIVGLHRLGRLGEARTAYQRYAAVMGDLAVPAEPWEYIITATPV